MRSLKEGEKTLTERVAQKVVAFITRKVRSINVVFYKKRLILAQPGEKDGAFLRIFLNFLKFFIKMTSS